MQTFAQAMEYLRKITFFGDKIGIERLEKLLDLLDNPHKKLKYIHITGTNGKGSISAILATLMGSMEIKTGIYTSPHLARYNERYRILSSPEECLNLQKNPQTGEISDEDFVRCLSKIKDCIESQYPTLEEAPTHFEICTALAFLYFLEKKCQYVILEVGMGGIFDATNIIPSPEISILSTISYDHKAYLGNTLPEIAKNKLGILKKGTQLIVYDDFDEDKGCSVDEKEAARKCIEEQVKQLNIPAYYVKPSFVKNSTGDITGSDWRLDTLAFSEPIHLPICQSVNLIGTHQYMNYAMAVHAFLLLKEGTIEKKQSVFWALNKVTWPARLEILAKDPIIILDGAHNAQGVQALIKNSKAFFKNQPIDIACGFMKDKDYSDVFNAILHGENGLKIANIYCLTPDWKSRALPAEELENYVKQHYPLYKEQVLACDFKTLKHIKEKAHNPLVIFGSLFLAKEARKTFKI